jgi:YihY family inner membrane protein
MNLVERSLRRIDAWQQRHRSVGFVLGVIKKSGDDRAGSLAASIAHYGFLALFPLLLLLTTAVGFVLERHPAAARAILHSALADFPIIGDQLRQSVHSFRGSGLGLAIGIAGLLWGSLGVTQVAQHAMAQIWNIPGVERPGLPSRVLRGLSLFVLIGLGVVASTLLSLLPNVTAASAAAGVLAVGLNVVLYLLGFRILTVPAVPTRHLVPGALLGGLAWSALQSFGGYLVIHQLRHASQVYGFFASVLGLVSWLHLSAQLTLFAAELNVVKARRLWPRSIVPPLVEADRRALDLIARQEERRPEQSVESSWGRPADSAEARRAVPIESVACIPDHGL